METENHPLLEIYPWEGPGYRPLVFSRGWQAALLNWEPIFDLANLREIERHNHTDEVFVLWRGRGAILVSDGLSTQVVDMQPGVVYNVTRRLACPGWPTVTLPDHRRRP
jgi:hypothetical protein